MTSLTGASGEDFASILRSLGYRMEKRPKPAEPEPVAALAGGRARRKLRGAIGRCRPQAAAPATEATETEVAEHAPTLAPDVEPERRA